MFLQFKVEKVWQINMLEYLEMKVSLQISSRIYVDLESL